MIKDIITSKHNNAIATANSLCSQLYTLKEDIEDIFDTVKFIKMQKMQIPNDCLRLIDENNNMMELKIEGGEISLDFINKATDQHCTFINNDFNIICADQLDSRFKTTKIAQFICFDNEYDFYTRQCCVLMQAFFDIFPLFKQRFIASVTAMLRLCQIENISLTH